MPTKIEWVINPDGTQGEVWNPTSGCSKVSAGCKFCYAEAIANRFWGERKFTDVRQHPERLDIPFHWKKPRRIFVDSMSDLFHRDVDFEFVDDVFDVIAHCPQHTFIILTKRPERMHDYMVYSRRFGTVVDVLPNLWLGVSTENQETADVRIPLLLRTPAAIRFVSYEPALSPVYFKLWRTKPCSVGCFSHISHPCEKCGYQAGKLPIDLIIAGCENGHKARHANIDWFRSVRDQCVNSDTKFFLKQMMVDGRLVKMPELDGIVYGQLP